ncbi:CPBP family intramembrane glutamic endopeptidase [Kitasatospora cinereorecta]|uniref:CPBP family intramembrane glutamic endopeptidase n=1 Tax=Kitasatospora cinereorecta TaxID=285560 RepID=UPI0031F791AA
MPSRWGLWGVAAALLVVDGLGEETGWRGFALPALQRRHSPLVATLLLTVAWAGWHAPMFAVVDTYHSIAGPLLVGWFIGLFCGAVVLTWLYNRSGSILLVAIWHTAYNIVSGTEAAKGVLAATSTTLVILLAATLVRLEIRAGRSNRPSILGPATSEDLSNQQTGITGGAT